MAERKHQLSFYAIWVKGCADVLGLAGNFPQSSIRGEQQSGACLGARQKKAGQNPVLLWAGDPWAGPAAYFPPAWLLLLLPGDRAEKYKDNTSPSMWDDEAKEMEVPWSIFSSISEAIVALPKPPRLPGWREEAHWLRPGPLALPDVGADAMVMPQLLPAESFLGSLPCTPYCSLSPGHLRPRHHLLISAGTPALKEADPQEERDLLSHVH